MLFWIPKKTERADLDRQRPLIFSISLLITMCLVIFAFEYRSIDQKKIDIQVKSIETMEEIMEVPPTEIAPPPPPAVVQPQIVEVANDEEIREEIKVEFDMEVTEETKVQEFTVYEQPVEEKENPEEIFLVVEQTATPQGGMVAFYKYVNSNLRYPAQALRMQIQGRVFVEFVVDRDGSITNVLVVKGIGAGCDEEAARVVQHAPQWIPGKQRGKPVRQRMVLPITFKLAV
ncbi:MAG TPA: energy transducer TonB [Flavitalea sp.]|nr:energy transducer TonB [Flavitalea sp.]